MATKKTVKKVDAPIDQHETFVSLQKTFADSEMSVSEKLKTLYELQAADSEMDKIIQLRGELPAEVEVLENEIADLKARSAQLAAVIEQLNRNIADAKLSIAEHESTVEKYQRQLETITNSREYDSLNKEIENQDLLRQIDEKNITDTRYEIAARKADLEHHHPDRGPEGQEGRARRDRRVHRQGRGCPAGAPRRLRREDRRPHDERLRAHPPERAQPPRRGFRVQRQRLRRLLQHHHPAAPGGDRLQQQAHHLRALRPRGRIIINPDFE